VVHQLSSRTVDSENSLLSLGFNCAGLSRDSLNFRQSFALSLKERVSAISCSARTQALSNMKLVMFTPRRSAPRRISLASLSLARTLNLCNRFLRAAVVGMERLSVCTLGSQRTYNVRSRREPVRHSWPKAINNRRRQEQRSGWSGIRMWKRIWRLLDTKPGVA
jgi:hypothetical protein